MSIERLLRIVALLIVTLALIDPALTFASRRRPVLAVSIVESPSLARPLADAAAGTETAMDRTRGLRARLVAALDGLFDVREGPAPDAAAQVLIGDGSFPTDTAIVDRAPLSAIAIDLAPSPNVRVLAVDAPRRVALTSRLRVAATVEARGMAGRTSIITLRAEGLEMARTTHAWSQPIETTIVTLDAVPFRTGLTRVTIGAEPLSAETTAADNDAETAVDVTSDPISVVFVEARPSWTTRFARQALEGDARFAVKTLSRVSRGLTAATTETPQALTLASLQPFAVVVVGAPEALTQADVDALRQFARLRGGAVIFAPDQRPSGAYVDLLPARAFDERLQDEPGIVRLTLDAAAASAAVAAPAAAAVPVAAAAAAGSAAAQTVPTLAASELAVPRDLLPGAEVLARLGDSHTGAPLVISSPLGDGEVLFLGALDAWRFRDALERRNASDPNRARDGAALAAAGRASSGPATGGRASAGTPNAGEASSGSATASAASAPGAGANGFDACWRQLVAIFGSRAPAPIDVAVEPPLAAPGSRVALRVRLRKTLINADGSIPQLVARVSDTGVRMGGAAGRELSSVRLWPTDQAGQFVGTLNAPAQTGVYAVSVELDRGAPVPFTAAGSAPLLVAPHAPVAAVSWDGLRAFVTARGGLFLSSADVPRLIEHLQQTVQASTTTRARHPFRSAWWMAPFAACLGGEWWLRRRRGQR
jgi:hypothetical protein